MAANGLSRVRTRSLRRDATALVSPAPRPTLASYWRDLCESVASTWAPRATGALVGDATGLLQKVLACDEFDQLLARERSLANRGTRVFGVIVLRRTSGDARDFGQLARCARQRLRATDLVGRLDGDRIGVLLADTGPAGTRAVAQWLDSTVDALGLCVESAIYIYPSVQDGDDADDRDRGSPPDSRRAVDPRLVASVHGRRGFGDSRASSRRSDAAPERWRDTHVEPRRASGRGPQALRATEDAVELPMQDLWLQLCIATPRWKRTLDVVLASVALIALAPLFGLVAIAIRLDSAGPLIFRQQRAGRGGKPFTFYKFRSMHVDAEARRAELLTRNEQCGPVFKIRNDPRMTRVGRILRRFSVDELPQIWNVLKGDISLVGPRSPTLDEVAGYERWQRDRLHVNGGLTCIWQVSGRSHVTFPEWMRMDMRYVRRCSPWLDVLLLARTLPAVVGGRGAY
ncbi:MAG: sugar transferase [Planctomycetota bacterium]